MIFGSPDILNALLGWLTAKYGDALVSATGRRILGSRQERAFRRIVDSAIEKSVDSAGKNLTSGQRKQLAKIIREHRAGISDVGDFAKIGDLVHRLIGTIAELDPLRVDRSYLADTLAFWITDGVARDAMSGGELAPLSDYVNFSKLFELSASSVEKLTRLEPLVGKIDETLALLRAIEERASGAARFPSGFGALIAERSHQFLGRTQFIAQIDAKLTELSSGYLIITGEPGIGKTSLIAYLVAQRDYVHYFNSRSEGTTTSGEFFANVCRQLVARYDLPKVLLTETPSSAHLSRVLQLAGASATERAPLIIAVDALDEAEEPQHGGNRLYLPRVLPPHTCIIATSRELTDDFLVVERRRDLHLADDSPENLQDISAYIQTRLSTPGESPVPWRIDPTELTEILTLHSEGNFLYIVHVLEDVRVGRLSPEALSNPRNLPVGLRAYYHMHWRVMKSRWPAVLADLYESAIRCLAVMREPVPIGSWADFAPDGVDELIARHVIGEWRQFLNVRRSTEYKEPLYSVYHTTFVDFLRDEGPGLSPYEGHVYQAQRAILLKLLNDPDNIP